MLPNNLNFTPFDPLTAAELNALVENTEALSDGSGIGPGAIGPSQRTGGYHIGTIAGSVTNSTGNKSITGVGFTPKLVRFSILPAASSSLAATAIGAMTPTSQFTTWTVVNAGANQSTRSSIDTRCIGYGSATGSTFIMSASYVSMDADGFTINVATASNAHDLVYEANG